ncbi:rRNA maturation RNase YbeY [Pelagibacterales bacterium]|jgi:probable rRNA maturation factor|nr:rRNA maturation RNase YbeY [Flavobacteriales bacterium]MBL6840799.1 rRNA maturation RNase YbeY [Pelagibacterales bacterium]MBL6861838.1 rRNA maturation RNase YbeY [Pelagibacterales bacterium]MDB9985698.1 rRNA maturation RNase YbeY [Pelagibacterales bacterium]
MMVNLDFSVLDNKWNETLPNFKKVIKKASNHVFDELIQFKNKDYEISFLMVNNDYIKELNANYRSKDSATNVLSFPMMDGNSLQHENILGDIVISIDKILSESLDQKIDTYKYLSKISIHGILHLLGYDHVLDNDYVVMNQLEEKIINKIK